MPREVSFDGMYLLFRQIYTGHDPSCYPSRKSNEDDKIKAKQVSCLTFTWVLLKIILILESVLWCIEVEYFYCHKGITYFDMLQGPVLYYVKFSLYFSVTQSCSLYCYSIMRQYNLYYAKNINLYRVSHCNSYLLALYVNI